jgi:hypothetical protein
LHTVRWWESVATTLKGLLARRRAALTVVAIAFLCWIAILVVDHVVHGLLDDPTSGAAMHSAALE